MTLNAKRRRERDDRNSSRFRQVAKTARVQRAKRLLDTTDLGMPEVASAAGFTSLRRFNAVFFEAYGRPPTAIRHRRAARPPGPLAAAAGRYAVWLLNPAIAF
jgi:methylphosphotriester-DNA--protein-cysteine methyltransferase